MEKVIRGRAFVFGKNIDTDQIYPSRFIEYTESEDIKRYAMYGADEQFTQKFQPGDIIVADTNFGCGSSREHAAMTLKAIEAGAIIADSFGRIFFRNIINLGVPAISCQHICQFVNTGDELEVDFANGTVKNLTTGQGTSFVPVSDYIMNILQHGGIKPMIKAQQEAKKQGRA